MKTDGTIDIEKLILENQDYIAHVFGIPSIIIIDRQVQVFQMSVWTLSVQLFHQQSTQVQIETVY